MEMIVFLIGLFLFGVLIVLPIWTITKLHGQQEKNEAFSRTLDGLVRELDNAKKEIRQLREELKSARSGPFTPTTVVPPPESVLRPFWGRPPEAVAPSAPVPVPVERPTETPASPPSPPPESLPPLPVPQQSAEEPPPVPEPAPAPGLVRKTAVPEIPPLPEAAPPLAPVPGYLAAAASPVPTARATPAVPATPAIPSAPVAPEPAANPGREINWEQFMGARLFAWLGGLAAFLAAAFFVKYSFEHDLIPPEVRVALGFLLSLGLIVGGLKINRERYAITAQTLCATGVVSLYAVTYACNSVYHFAFFGAIPTFLLMTLITGAAFLLAVRMEARVVAVLGMLGGFLTPVLLSTGQDNPVGLFGYIALLDAGLVAVVLHRRWNFLIPLGAAGTALMQAGWAMKFFADEKALTAIVVVAGFAALFGGVAVVARRRGQGEESFSWTAIGMAAVCYAFALMFLGHPALRLQAGYLFSLVLLANLGLFALAWLDELPPGVIVAAGGTAVVLAGWAAQAMNPGEAPVLMLVSLGFCALFLGAYLLAYRRENFAPEIAWSAVVMPWLALGLALAPVVSVGGLHPARLFGFALAADGCLLVVNWFDNRFSRMHLASGLALFLLLAVWTGSHLTAGLLPWALAFYLVHALVHTAYPLLLERNRHDHGAPGPWSQLFPPLALVLMLVPLCRIEEISLAFWPCVLLVDLLAIGLALLTASLLAVAAVLLLTLAATGLWIFQVPATAASAPELLVVIGAAALLFFGAGVFLARKLGDRLNHADRWPAFFGDARTQIPAFSALLPFLLLIMMTERLPLANPSAVFGLALLLAVLVAGLAVIAQLEWLPMCALAGVAALEYAWRARQTAGIDAPLALGWYLLFYAGFAAFPFLVRRRVAAQTGPWVVAALAGVAQFPLVYQLVQSEWPNQVPGLLPALFALAPLASLAAVARGAEVDARARLNQLAWFGGVALLFITLVFPIQFDREWLTIAWGLEGAALLWLFHRVPHPGLRVTGVVLLCTAFARLAVNPAVLSYHARSATPVFNWYLYTYGVVTAGLFIGARLLAPPRSRVLNTEAPPLLNTLGTILAFLLLNIEIADFFSAPGQGVLVFQFSGNFGRDMTYTIAWALFALGLLLMSIWRQTRTGRYAALALLGVALLKLFFHDLARLDALYRVGALAGVAVIAIVASFAYQRFLPGNHDAPPPKP